MRLRDNLVVSSTQGVHHMQKALFQMNVQLGNVISDFVGESGMPWIPWFGAPGCFPRSLTRKSL
jgi:hypothetical protein